MGNVLLTVVILLTAVPGVRGGVQLLRLKREGGGKRPVGAGVLLLVLTALATASLLVTHYLDLLL